MSPCAQNMTPAEVRATLFTRWDAIMQSPLLPGFHCPRVQRALEQSAFALAVALFIWLAWVFWPDARIAINDTFSALGK